MTRWRHVLLAMFAAYIFALGFHAGWRAEQGLSHALLCSAIVPIAFGIVGGLIVADEHWDFI